MESRIKMLREKRGLIQELLAVEIGVTQQMLSKYEKDITIIKVDSMQLSMLKQLLSKKLINENEYQIILKRLMKDYGIISNITA